MNARDFCFFSTPVMHVSTLAWGLTMALVVAGALLSGCGTFIGQPTSKPTQTPYGTPQPTATPSTQAPSVPAPSTTVSPQKPVPEAVEAPQPAKPAEALAEKPPAKTVSTAPKKVHHRPHKQEKAVTHAAPKPASVKAKPALAPAPKQVTLAPTTPTQPAPLMLTADKLPYTVGNWTLEQNWDNQHPGVCRLVSKHQKMDDGYDKTDIWTEILPDRIEVHTGSNIDLSYQGIGIQFDDSALVPVKGLVGKMGVDVPGHFSDQVAGAKNMVIHLGFWPTWPKTQLQQVQIPLEGAGVLMPSLLDCKKR
jgi:hypothetical protein